MKNNNFRQAQSVTFKCAYDGTPMEVRYNPYIKEFPVYIRIGYDRDDKGMVFSDKKQLNHLINMLSQYRLDWCNREASKRKVSK